MLYGIRSVMTMDVWWGIWTFLRREPDNADSYRKTQHHNQQSIATLVLDMLG